MLAPCIRVFCKNFQFCYNNYFRLKLFLQIWWTALSVALGLDIRGEVIRGVPCIKRYHQLFCPTAGNTYPM